MKKSSNLNVTNLWKVLRTECETALKKEPTLAPFFNDHLLNQTSFDGSLAAILSAQMASPEINRDKLYALFMTCMNKNSDIISCAKKDLLAVMDRDPAVESVRTAFLYFKGYQAIQVHRIAHQLWRDKRKDWRNGGCR